MCSSLLRNEVTKKLVGACTARFSHSIRSITEIKDFPLCVNSATEIRDFLPHLYLTYRFRSEGQNLFYGFS